MSSRARKAVVLIRNFPKSNGEAPGLRSTRTVFLRRPRTGVVRLFDLLDGFKNAVLLLEVSPALTTIGETLTHHGTRFHAPEDVEKVVRIAAHERSGESDQLLCSPSEHAQGIALSRITGKLVQLVRDG